MLNYRKHNLWRAFVDFLFDNDKKVASEIYNHIKVRVQKPYPIYDQNSWKTIPFGAAHTYIAHIREYPLPPRALFKQEEFENANLEKDGVMMITWFPWPSSPQTQIQTDRWSIFARLNFFNVVWLQNIEMEALKFQQHHLLNLSSLGDLFAVFVTGGN